MNKQVAIIKDVIRKTPHAVVFKSDSSIICKSLTSFGQSIIDECISDGNIHSEKLPAGFSSTGFHPVTPAIEELIGGHLEGGVKTAIQESIIVPNALTSIHKFSGRKSISGNKQKPRQSVFDTRLRDFRYKGSRFAAIDFKTSMFKKELAKKSLISKIKSHSIIFNSQQNRLVGKKNNSASDVVASQITADYGAGNIRRAMKHKTLQLPQTSSRRLSRKADILTSISIEERGGVQKSSRFIVNRSA